MFRIRSILRELQLSHWCVYEEYDVATYMKYMVPAHFRSTTSNYNTDSTEHSPSRKRIVERVRGLRNPRSSRRTRRRIVNQVIAMTRMSATIRGTRDKIVTAMVLGEREYRTVWLGRLTSTITRLVDAALRSVSITLTSWLGGQ